MIEYSLNDSGVFCVKFSGTVTMKDIEDYLLEFELIEDPPKDLISLYDLREAKMNLDSKDIMRISELTKKATASYKTVRTAFLVNKPLLTAYSLIFSNDSPSGKTVREVFSTEEAAIKWLLKIQS